MEKEIEIIKKYLKTIEKRLDKKEAEELDYDKIEKVKKSLDYMLKPNRIKYIIKLINEESIEIFMQLKDDLYEYDYRESGVDAKPKEELTEKDIRKIFKKGKIYRIKSTLDKKEYIGSTTVDINTRLLYHIISSCESDATKKLYKYFNKNGWKNFQMELVEKHACKNNGELLDRETYYYGKIPTKYCLNVNIPKTNNTYNITTKCLSAVKLPSKKLQIKKPTKKLEKKDFSTRQKRSKIGKKRVEYIGKTVEEMKIEIKKLKKRSDKLLDKEIEDANSETENKKTNTKIKRRYIHYSSGMREIKMNTKLIKHLKNMIKKECSD